ncbi:MAG: helix-turn-helix domain-containing protein [Planctomycetes bacterium]|nr:helix-turn-helix domain-containing protein [Planctomycetota bacterium]
MKEVKSPKIFYTIPEVARLLGCSVNTAYRWAKDGEFPGVTRVGGRVLVFRNVFDEWRRGVN